MIFYEAPHKLQNTLKDLTDAFGPERRISLCRELTKLHEQILRMTLGEALAYYTENDPRGEYVLILEGAAEASEEALTLEDAVSLALERIASGTSKKDAVREVSRETGFPKMRSMTPSCVCRTQIELSIERSTAMATSPDYITYVCDQLAGFQPLRYRKMFGEYMVYLSDRPILTVCDNTVYVKMYPELAQLLDGARAPHRMKARSRITSSISKSPASGAAHSAPGGADAASEAEEGLTADYPNRKSPQSFDCGLSHIHQLAAFMLKAQGPSEG